MLEEVFDFVFVVVVEVVFLMEFERGVSVLTLDVLVLENVGAGEVGVVGCCCV